ncbi:oxidative damage protection protein [Buchnera aphidicola]|uniref:oxidative damage protection protein n=1 Tax=Buchnera aphidicola TaxID=9 RepID=UPI003463F7D0
MKIVFCKYFKKMLSGFDYQFYPGDLGKKIYNNISKDAWKKWMIEQTKFINENNLNMIKISDYKKVEKHMIYFLFGKK